MTIKIRQMLTIFIPCPNFKKYLLLGIDITHTFKLIILNSMVPKQNFRVKITQRYLMVFFSPCYTFKWFCLFNLSSLKFANYIKGDTRGKKDMGEYFPVYSIELVDVQVHFQLTNICCSFCFPVVLG